MNFSGFKFLFVVYEVTVSFFKFYKKIKINILMLA